MNEEKMDLIIKEADLVVSTPKSPHQFKMEKMDIAIKDGKIHQIGTLNKMESEKFWKAKGLTILPGLIDTQVHFREPGLEHKETIADGSRSAIAGGITGFFEMPNTSPPTLTAKAMANKVRIGKETSWCDFAFYIGAAEENTGCCGVKVFMGSSTGSLLVDRADSLKRVLQNTRRRVAVHCEDEPRLLERRPIAENAHGDVQKHEEWRDWESSLIATKRLLKLSKELNHPVHILHVSTKQEMELLQEEKTNDHRITVETTPQHLTLESPDCYLNLGTKSQMNPPIRDTHHRQALWRALKTGVVDVLGSDHAPHTLQEKSKTYPNTPSGMPGVQTTLPLMLNHIHKGHIHLFDIVRLLAVNPSLIWGIKNRGFLCPNKEASLTIVDLHKEKVIEDSWIESKCGWTPFHGQKNKGWPVATLLRGQFAMKDGELFKVASKAFEFEN